MVKTLKGVLRRKQIHIKEAAMPGPQVSTKQAPAAAPMAPRQLISKIIEPAKTIEILRTAAKPPSTHPTGLEKPRVATMPLVSQSLHFHHLCLHLHKGSQA